MPFPRGSVGGGRSKYYVTEGGNESCSATRKGRPTEREGPSRTETRYEIGPTLSTKTFVSRNCEILVEVAIVSGLLAACARICEDWEPKFAILCTFLAQTFCFWAFERGIISCKENSYVSFSTFYANTCISTTIVAFYMNKSSGRARGEVLRIFG